MSRKEQFVKALLLSALIWWLFEIINYRIGNWDYSGVLPETFTLRKFYGTIAFATVLPAIIETFELLKTFNLFNKLKLKKHHDISHGFLHLMTFLGVVMISLSIFWPRYFFPLVWVAFFFILDPINYLHSQPSIIGYWKNGNYKTPLILFVAGIVTGLLWEFWNYYAVTKWYYEIPFVDFFKIFEMPILGYLGYGPFAFELFAMYYFARSLHKPKTTHSLIELKKI